MTPFVAVASKLAQSTARTMTRPSADTDAPLGVIERSPLSMPIRSAETTLRLRPLMVTVNFSGPRSGTG